MNVDSMNANNLPVTWIRHEAIAGRGAAGDGPQHAERWQDRGCVIALLVALCPTILIPSVPPVVHFTSVVGASLPQRRASRMMFGAVIYFWFASEISISLVPFIFVWLLATMVSVISGSVTTFADTRVRFACASESSTKSDQVPDMAQVSPTMELTSEGIGKFEL